MFTFRFPINANLVRLVGSDTDPQTLVGPIRSRRYVARQPHTPVVVPVVRIEPVAIRAAGEVPIVGPEGTFEQKVTVKKGIKGK
jgi:hypothetical protein